MNEYTKRKGIASFIAFVSILVIIFFDTGGNDSVKVLDGDTFIFEGERIRLIGADTPERSVPEPFSEEATLFTTEQMSQPFVLEPLSSRDRDVYDRLLRSVVFDTGERLEVLLVQQGLARVYYDASVDPAVMNLLCSEEQKARERHEGIWKPETEAYFLRKTPRCPQ